MYLVHFATLIWIDLVHFTEKTPCYSLFLKNLNYNLFTPLSQVLSVTDYYWGSLRVQTILFLWVLQTTRITFRKKKSESLITIKLIILVFFTYYSECYLHNIHFNLSLCIFMDNQIHGVSTGRLKEAACAKTKKKKKKTCRSV